MQMRLRFVVGGLLIATIASACSAGRGDVSAESESLLSGNSDPRAEFESILPAVYAGVEEALRSFDDDEHETVPSPEYQYDVRTTDSLVSPYTGEVVIQYVEHFTPVDSEPFTAANTLTVMYAYQEEVWVPVQVVKYSGLLEKSFDQHPETREFWDGHLPNG